MESESIPLLPISIHKALASLDLAHSLIYPVTLGFQSTRLSRASTTSDTGLPAIIIFQSTRLSRASTRHSNDKRTTTIISIHKALASLDVICLFFSRLLSQFQSTRLSRASTREIGPPEVFQIISIHKALASLDFFAGKQVVRGNIFQSTRLSRAST